MTHPQSLEPVRVLALGGSTRPMAASERALRIAGSSAERRGAVVTYITGRDLMLPIYDTESLERSAGALRVIEGLRSADAVLLASPGYHGSVSGMIKNALDYAEDLRHDERPYLHDRAAGCIAVAHGWQTAVGTLGELRQIVHALRGWPAPMGCAINDSTGVIGDDAEDTDPGVVRQLATVGEQVVEFALAMRGIRERPGLG